MMRAIAESVILGDAQRHDVRVIAYSSSFTMSSIAPTLFVRKIENCLTSGPPIFDVVSGNFAVIGKVLRSFRLLFAQQLPRKEPNYFAFRLTMQT